MSTNTNKLSGKVALVTGGSRGIGAAIAKRLAADGAAVAITYSSGQQKADEVVRAIEKAGGRTLAIKADNNDASAVKRAVTETVKTLGRIDVLVNNAGIAKIAPLDQLSLEGLRSFGGSECPRGLRRGAGSGPSHGRGRTHHHHRQHQRRAHALRRRQRYAMTKAAIVGLTKGLARDLGPRGITVNNVQPGPVETDMNPADGPFAETLKGFMAIKRYGRGDEIAGMVSYLAGPEAAYVTGASLTIDRGFAP